MSLNEIHYQPLTTVAKHIAAGDISPVEVTQSILARIEELDPKLKSYTTVTAELALKQAKAAEAEIGKGIYRGPMHGIPIAVKDLCFTKDIKTTGGMTIYADFHPDHDATVVTKLAQAGAVLLGKLHMTEGATIEHHPDLPEPVNPWKSDLWTGVSSSGSGVATAAGMTYAAIGSDTGGSIRFPSACNGLTGVKPTWGRISRYGIFDLAATFDHLGPMARSAADAAAMLQCLAGWDPKDTTSLSSAVPDYLGELDGIYGARGVKIGFDWDYAGSDADPVTIGLIRDAVAVLAELGALTQPVAFPSVESLLQYTMPMTMAEMAACHEGTYPSQADQYGTWIKQGMEAGRTASPVEIGKGIVERFKFRGALNRMFDDVDVFVMPVFRTGTPTWTEVREAVAQDFNIIGKFTSPFNATGTPTVTLPCGYTDDGRPVAFQLAGANGSEALLLRVAHAYQQATDWHTRRPPGH
ncbi:amidase [Lichenifustis flavocetrariae]|uniref:Indoleacetamide hydrolase n=1 Tax=Lichenifustis flavocetrariae TaxID=2949735 RepID=A0AA41YUU8_9HYPH|nr:amidase [Lichenifustis flavocetrariae]MCW6507462.1 amidase [Lichenifustis flavocetrariae]